MEDDWKTFRDIRNSLKKEIKKTKLESHCQASSSKRPKEVWNVNHSVLKPNSIEINADPQKLNNFFSATAHRLLNSKKIPQQHLQKITSAG